MTKYLKISNGIEIEPNAFKLLGACTKRGDTSKIGYFGSGLKYAIAVMMREGVEMRIFSGMREVVLGTISENFRDNVFHIITIDGEKTSLTTSMGVDWKLWQAIREIYCNALDEEDCDIKRGECEAVGEEGCTIFYIPIVDGLQDIINKWDKYFAYNRETLVYNKIGSVYETVDDTATIYRRGIRCYDTKEKSLYDYELPKISINESRVISMTWDISTNLHKIWSQLATRDMIASLCKHFKKIGEKTKYLEDRMDWRQYELNFSDTWLEYFENKILIPEEQAGDYLDYVNQPNSVIIPIRLIKALQHKFGDKIKCCSINFNMGDDWVEAIPDSKRTHLLDKAKSFLTECGLKVEYDIIVAVFEAKNILGSILAPDKIILSVDIFDKGLRMIVHALLEETAHLETGLGDETRAFQNHFIGKVITLLEEKTGNFL